MSEFYDPSYGDERMCECGHAYHWHFNVERGYIPWGCFFSHNCDCEEFKEKKDEG